MARAIWTGSLSFGLVNVPVRLYAATSEHKVSFHQFEKGTSSRIRNKRVNEDTGDEVDFEDIVKGAELDRGRYVILTPEELESVEPTRSRTIDISDFVDASEIDPVYYNKSYYLAPADETAKKPYQLLLAAMEKAGRIGIATFVMRERQYLAAIRPQDGVLVLETMYFADEVRDPRKELDNLPGKGAARGKDLDMAVGLIKSLTTKWDPTNYRDTYTARVEKLIKAKKDDREIVTEHSEDAGPEKVTDLLAALQASVEAAKNHKPGNASRVTRLRIQKKAAEDEKKPAQKAKKTAKKTAKKSARSTTKKTAKKTASKRTVKKAS